MANDGTAGLPTSVDVVVVGAGLAGLATALELTGAAMPHDPARVDAARVDAARVDAARARPDVLVLEAGPVPGGRVRTDEVDGMRLDRGFQLLNPAYPAVRRTVDTAALDLRPLVPGVGVRLEHGGARLGDPRRSPGLALPSALAPVGGPVAKARFAAWCLRALRSAPEHLREQPDTTTAEALRAAGVDGDIVERVLRPFLTGVFLEPDLATSRRVADLFVRAFLRGTPSLPSRGMAALPLHLAARLAPGVLRTQAVVDAVAPGRVVVDGTTVRAGAVVVATDPVTAAALLPGVPAPTMRPVTTWYHLADTPPGALTRGAPLLVVDGRRVKGPVATTVVTTHAAPGLAPGRVLVSSSVLGTATDAAAARAVQAHLAELYGVATDGWQQVHVVPVPHALPAATPPHDVRRPVALGDGLFVAGDHRDTPSIQGALASGRRTAAAVLTHLGSPARP